MLFQVGVSCRILNFIVSYLYVSCSGSINAVGEERAIFFCYRLLVIMLFLFGEVSSSLGTESGTHWAFNIFIVELFIRDACLRLIYIVQTGLCMCQSTRFTLTKDEKMSTLVHPSFTI